MRHIPSLLVVPAALVAAAVPAYAADYLTIPQAQQALFPDAESFVDATVALDDGQRAAIEKLSGVRQRWKKQAVWRAEKGGAHIGWFIVDDVIGKHEYITYATALSPDAKVLGIEILSYRETHGHQIRNADWRNRFVGKTLTDPFKLDQDVPNISGATLSCRNVTNGVKRLLALQELVLGRAR
jgi:Na+-translocating ferredoxin:NAD+ oxidoreductase RnfG subunit